MKAKKTILAVVGLLLIVLVVFAVRNQKTVRIKVQVKDEIVRVSLVEGELHSVKECEQMLASAIASNQVRLVVADLPVSYPETSDSNLGLVTESLKGLILAREIRYIYYYSERDHVSVNDISFIVVEVPYEHPMNFKEAKIYLDGLECGRGDEGMQQLLEKCRMKPPKCVATVLGLYTGKGSWPSPPFHPALPEKYRSEIKNIVEQAAGKEVQMQYFFE